MSRQLKKNFFHGLGVNWALGLFWVISGLKRGIFEHFPIKFYIFLLLYLFLYFKTKMKLIWDLQEKILPTKFVEKAVQRLQKWRFSFKNVGYSNKKSCKINIDAPKMLKNCSKGFQESSLDDPRWSQQYFFSKFWSRDFQTFVIGQKWIFKKCRPVIKTFQMPTYLNEKGSNTA